MEELTIRNVDIEKELNFSNKKSFVNQKIVDEIDEESEIDNCRLGTERKYFFTKLIPNENERIEEDEVKVQNVKIDNSTGINRTSQNLKRNRRSKKLGWRKTTYGE